MDVDGHWSCTNREFNIIMKLIESPINSTDKSIIQEGLNITLQGNLMTVSSGTLIMSGEKMAFPENIVMELDDGVANVAIAKEKDSGKYVILLLDLDNAIDETKFELKMVIAWKQSLPIDEIVDGEDKAWYKIKVNNEVPEFPEKMELPTNPGEIPQKEAEKIYGRTIHLNNKN